MVAREAMGKGRGAAAAARAVAASLAVGAAFLAASSPASPQALRPAPYSRLVHLFDYKRGLPLSLRILSQTQRNGVTVQEISYAIDGSTREVGYLFRPAGAGPFPAVVFAPGRGGNKDGFYPEALADAQRGAVAVSLDDLDGGYPTFTRRDRGILIHRAIALRRAIDLVLTQPGVDPSRLGYVGHSDGAELGGILAGVDGRASTYVLMSGGGRWDRPKSAAYARLIAPLDPDRYVGHAAPATLFYQSGLSDQYIPRAEAAQFQRLGSRPKMVKWYAADHWLDEQAQQDRQAWLAGKLGFSSSPRSMASTGRSPGVSSSH